MVPCESRFPSHRSPPARPLSLSFQHFTNPSPPSPRHPRLISSLLSSRYKFLVSQPLYFHIHPNPPGVPLPPHTTDPRRAFFLAIIRSMFSATYRLFFLSCPHFRPRHPFFSITSSLFSKNTRGGYPPVSSHVDAAPTMASMQPTQFLSPFSFRALAHDVAPQLSREFSTCP